MNDSFGRIIFLVTIGIALIGGMWLGYQGGVNHYQKQSRRGWPALCVINKPGLPLLSLRGNHEIA
jgi:hypothetical protein